MIHPKTKHTSIGVSLRSAAATRVSIFKAAPKPVVYEGCRRMPVKQRGISQIHLCYILRAETSTVVQSATTFLVIIYTRYMREKIT